MFRAPRDATTHPRSHLTSVFLNRLNTRSNPFFKEFNMLKFYRIATLSFLAALSSSPIYAEDVAEDAPAAHMAHSEMTKGITVNGATISPERIDMHIKAALGQGRADTPQLRTAVEDELISLELMAQDAINNGLDKTAETQRQLEMARQSALIGAFVQGHFARHPITEEDIRREYDKVKNSTTEIEYKARHILVKAEKDAKKILSRLKKGAKFDQIAKAQSLDKGSSVKGGDLGWSLSSNFVPPFANALKELKKGKLSDPVKTEFGWHILKLDDTRDLKFPAYQDVKKNITQRLQQQSIQKAIGNLRAVAKIE
jgi:peptidyl-prolyl cis-trans isomerase C